MSAQIAAHGVRLRTQGENEGVRIQESGARRKHWYKAKGID